MGEADPDFVWQDYLEDTNTEEVEATAFTHVEHSLDSGLKVGMKLEVPNPDDSETYWIASVRMICGDLLLLRTAGYNDSSADNWFTVKESEFHPVGWCTTNNKKLFPPKQILEKYPDLDTLILTELKNAQTIPMYLYNDLKTGVLPIDKIKCGMKLEIAEIFNSQRIWIASIVKNVGGRLLLKYDGIKNDLNKEIWLYYLDDRLHLAGYAGDNNLQYLPPEEIKSQCSGKEWADTLKLSLKKAKENKFPSQILKPKVPLKKHNFVKGMKMEVVNTSNFTDICPATVTQILDDFHFLITIDFHQKDEMTCIFCCNSNYPYIFPVGWAEKNGLELKKPEGYGSESSAKFSWKEYLQSENSKPAPFEFFAVNISNTGFQVGKKLEAADPFQPGVIKAATIVKVVSPLIWLHFDNEESKENHVIRSMNSFDIFPVGWCASNSFPLLTPRVYKPEEKEDTAKKEAKESGSKSRHEAVSCTPPVQQSKSWCPKIYFNHRCFTGPLLSKSKLAELPQAIGPGPLHLVIKDVIHRIVNIAYKSSRVLQLIQINGKPKAGMDQQLIKAKYKGKINIATIEVIRNSEQVEEYCKNICLKLECCPNLFGPKHVGETCPDSCHTQTKTKFGYYFVKKNKVGRPSLKPTEEKEQEETNSEQSKKGRGRKRKRLHWKHLLRLHELAHKEKTRDSSETDDTSKSDSKTKSPDYKPPKVSGKKQLKLTPSSNIVTRGAKLPNFGLWHHHSAFHSRRGRPRTRPIRPPIFPPRKVGRPLGSTKKAMMAARKNEKKAEVVDICKSSSDEEDNLSVQELAIPPKPMAIESNPLDWSVEEVAQYLKKTEYAAVAPFLKEQEIDGQALLMLNKYSIEKFLHLKKEPAEKLCYLIKNLKIEFFNKYVT